MDEPKAAGPASGRLSWQFLYRTDAGRIGASTWWRGVLILAAIFAVLTLGYIFVRPYARHDLNTTSSVSLAIFGANLYIVCYYFAVMLIGICYYNLSAKRLRDRGRAPALAGLLPFLVLVASVAHWLASNAAMFTPAAAVIAVDVLLAFTVLWNILDLGELWPSGRRDGVS